MPTYFTPPALSSNKVLTASYLNQINDDLLVISTHNHSGSLGEGSTDISGIGFSGSFFDRYEIACLIAPSQTGFGIRQDINYLFMGALVNLTVGAASVAFPLFLRKGIYKLWELHDNDTGSGSLTACIGTTLNTNTSVIGTVVQNPAGDFSVCTVGNASIASSGSYVIKFGKSNNLNLTAVLGAFKIMRTGDY